MEGFGFGGGENNVQKSILNSASFVLQGQNIARDNRQLPERKTVLKKKGC